MTGLEADSTPETVAWGKREEPRLTAELLHSTGLQQLSLLQVFSEFSLGQEMAHLFAGSWGKKGRNAGRAEESSFQSKKEQQDNKCIHFSHHSPLKITKTKCLPSLKRSDRAWSRDKPTSVLVKYSNSSSSKAQGSWICFPHGSN